MSRRSFALVAAGCSIAAALAVAAPASGDDGRHTVSYRGVSPVTPATFGQAFVGDVSRCTFAPPTFSLAEPCVNPVTVTPGFDNVFTGDLTGGYKSAEAGVLGVLVSLDPADIDVPFVSYTRFVGTVAGCGAGSMVIRSDGNLGGASETWSIVPNSGRGALAGISGSGTGLTVSATEAGIVTDYTGRIRCGRHHDA